MTSPPRKRFVIRPANGSDETVARLLKEMHARIFAETAPQIEPEKGWWWIAWAKAEAAGFCGLTQAYGCTKTGFLKRAGVYSRFRGNGLQRRFVKVREAQAQELGFTRIISDTTDNCSSANNLIACGYRLYWPEGPWGFVQTNYWSKDI